MAANNENFTFLMFSSFMCPGSDYLFSLCPFNVSIWYLRQSLVDWWPPSAPASACMRFRSVWRISIDQKTYTCRSLVPYHIDFTFGIGGPMILQGTLTAHIQPLAGLIGRLDRSISRQLGGGSQGICSFAPISSNSSLMELGF
jgi:hypothetical protein